MLLITQLSKQTGVPVATIRYYETFGLFKGVKKTDVRSNNYTYYGDDIVYKLNLIRDGKSAGFTLTEMKTLIDAWSNQQLSNAEKIAILDKKCLTLDEKIIELERMKTQIQVFKAQIEG
jgi:MerR family transcriptional regulator, copper efflux regulator